MRGGFSSSPGADLFATSCTGKKTPGEPGHARDTGTYRQLLEQTLQTFQQWLYEQPFHLVQTSGGMTNKMKRLLHGASRSLGQTNRANYHEWRARLNDTPWKLQVPRPHLRFGNLAGLPSVYGFDRWKAHTGEDESFNMTRRQGITVITQRMTGHTSHSAHTCTASVGLWAILKLQRGPSWFT